MSMGKPKFLFEKSGFLNKDAAKLLFDQKFTKKEDRNFCLLFLFTYSLRNLCQRLHQRLEKGVQLCRKENAQDQSRHCQNQNYDPHS